MSKKKISQNELDNMHELAEEARDNSYCEYSGYRVGAAVRMDSGRIYTGCNIENSSYGATICAERVAIFKAVADGEKRITDVVIVTDSPEGWPPCGLCRQVISEFSHKTMIHIANTKEIVKSISFNDIMPMAFVPDHMIGNK